MNAQLEYVEELDDVPEDERTAPWRLKKLTPRHKQVAALVAQGMKQVDIARLAGCTPQYVHMLTKQPLVIEHMQRVAEVAGIQLDAMFGKVVEVIGETLSGGTESGKLKAARLHLEATKRIGRNDSAPPSTENADERLVRLAERLVALMPSHHQRGVVYESETAQDAVVLRTTQRPSGQEKDQETKDPEE